MSRQSSSDRRSFLKNTALAGVAVTILPSWAKGYSPLIADPIGYTQQALPYAYAALEPIIDATTMEIHYTKHAATYTKNLTDAVTAEKVDVKQVSLEALV